MTETEKTSEKVVIETEFIGGLTKLSTHVTKFGHLFTSESRHESLARRPNTMAIPVEGSEGMYVRFGIPEGMRESGAPAIKTLSYDKFNQLIEDLPDKMGGLEDANLDVYYVGNVIVGIEATPNK